MRSVAPAAVSAASSEPRFPVPVQAVRPKPRRPAAGRALAGSVPGRPDGGGQGAPDLPAPMPVAAGPAVVNVAAPGMPAPDATDRRDPPGREAGITFGEQAK